MKKNYMKKIGILLIAVLITSVAAASVLALFLKSTDKVENTFIPAVSANPVINETFSNNLKENVSMTNITVEEIKVSLVGNYLVEYEIMYNKNIIIWL